MRKDKVSVSNVKTTNIRTGEVKQTKVETTTLDERPNIWNLQAFVIVFLFIMLATTINVYSVNNDNLTWVDSNGNFKLDSYNHSMINLDTDLIELNNQSLNDVFLNGNEIQNPTFDSYNTYTGSLDIDNNRGKIVSTNVFETTFQTTYTISYPLNNVFYYSIDIESDNFSPSGDAQLYPIFSPFIDSIYIFITNTDNNTYSGLKTMSNGGIGVMRYDNNGGVGNNVTHWVDNFYFINLTSLGIDNLTQAQMDQWLDLYLSLQENRIEAYKDLGNEPISQWQNLTQIISDIMGAVAGPISDTINWIDKFMFGLFS